MKHGILKFSLSSVVVFAATFMALPQIALSNDGAEASTPYSFVKKRYSINGSAQLLSTDNGVEIKFSEDFKTRGGPDLKVYLSKQTVTELQSDSVKPTSLKIGVLKSKSGAQSYILPEGISLSDYKSVVIHCEAFSVLWGGFDL